jgi:dTDP-4-amino-4,6-dideoxygalactose transaminase
MRRNNAKYLTLKLSGVSQIVLPQEPKNYRHIFQMYTIKVNDKKLRDGLKDYLNKITATYSFNLLPHVTQNIALAFNSPEGIITLYNSACSPCGHYGLIS